MCNYFTRLHKEECKRVSRRIYIYINNSSSHHFLLGRKEGRKRGGEMTADEPLMFIRKQEVT